MKKAVLHVVLLVCALGLMLSVSAGLSAQATGGLVWAEEGAGAPPNGQVNLDGLILEEETTGVKTLTSEAVYVAGGADCACCEHCPLCYDQETGARIAGACHCVDGSLAGCGCECTFAINLTDEDFLEKLQASLFIYDADGNPISDRETWLSAYGEVVAPLGQPVQLMEGEDVAAYISGKNYETVTGLADDGTVWVDCGCDCHEVREAMMPLAAPNPLPNGDKPYWYEAAPDDPYVDRFPEPGYIVYNYRQLRQVIRSGHTVSSGGTAWTGYDNGIDTSITNDASYDRGWSSGTYSFSENPSDPYTGGLKRVIYLGWAWHQDPAQRPDPLTQFTMTPAAIYAPREIAQIKVIGTDPYQNQKMRLITPYTDGQYDTFYPYYRYQHFTLQDADVLNRHYFGIATSGDVQDVNYPYYTGAKIEYVRVVCEGSQISFNRAVNGYVIFEDTQTFIRPAADGMTLYGAGGPNQHLDEWIEADNVYIRGYNLVTRGMDSDPSGPIGSGKWIDYNPFIYFAGTSKGIVLEKGATLEVRSDGNVIEAPYKQVFMQCASTANRPNITLREGATFIIDSPGAFTLNDAHRLGTMHIMKDAKVLVNTARDLEIDAGTYFNMGELIIEDGGELSVNYKRSSNQSTSDHAVYCRGNVTVSTDGVVNITKNGGGGHALGLDANQTISLGERGRINITHTGGAYNAIYASGGTIQMATGGTIDVDYNGGAQAIVASNILMDEGGVLDVEYNGTGGTAAVINATTRIVGERNSEIIINQNAYGGNAIQSPLISGKGAVNITMNSGLRALSTVDGTGTALTGSIEIGNLNVHKKSTSTPQHVIHGGQVTLNGLSGTATQDAGGNSYYVINAANVAFDIGCDVTLVQNSGAHTIGATTAITPLGNVTLTKNSGSATGSVLRAPSITFAPVTQSEPQSVKIYQYGGEDTIWAASPAASASTRPTGTFRTDSLATSVSIEKAGNATQSVFYGNDLMSHGDLRIDMQAGTVVGRDMRYFSPGATTVIRRRISDANPVFTFASVAYHPTARVNGIALNDPRLLFISNQNGPLMTGGSTTYLASLSGLASVLNFTDGANERTWNTNLNSNAGGNVRFTLKADVAGTAMRNLTSGLENEGRGAAPYPYEDPMNTSTFNLTSGGFQSLIAYHQDPVKIATPIKERTAVTGSSSATADTRIRGLEYAATTKVDDTTFRYEQQINESGWIAGGNGYQLSMNNPLSVNKSMLFVESEKTISMPELSKTLSAYAYTNVEGVVEMTVGDLAFEDANRMSFDQTVKRQDTDWPITVYDSRGYAFEGVWYPQTWSLSVTAQDYFRNDVISSKYLPYSRAVLKEAGSTVPLNPGAQVTVVPTTSLSLAERTNRVLTWGEDEGFLFAYDARDESVIAVNADTDESYQTIMKWTLTF